MATRSKPFDVIRLTVTFVCVTLLTVLLAAVGTDWSARQAQRYFAELEAAYGSEMQPGTVITYGQLYEDEQSALEDWQGPLSAFEEQDWRDIPALYIPQEDELFCQFYAAAAVLVFSLTLAAGLLGALWRRLGLGRGFWGRLPLEWHVFIGFCMLACCMDGAGHIVWAARDGTFADVAHTLFFLDADDSMLLGKAVAAGLLWLGVFFVFEAGAALGAGLRDGFWRYLRCRCLIVRVPAALWGRCGAAVRRFAAVDLRRPVESTLLRLLSINFLLVALLCSVWFAGIAGALIYSFVLFFILRRWFARLQKNYNTVLAHAQRMAQGSLDTPLEEDVGILNPLREELNAVQAGFARAVREEVRSQNMKTELITNVSHDLKTPLTAIITYVDLLKDDSLDEATRREYVATLEKKSQRLKRLIEDLFEMSKAASGSVTLHKETVELASLMRQLQFELEDATAACGVDFRWSLPPEKLYAELDGQKTFRVLENLVVNITKYALAGTRAYISLQREGRRAVVTMKNVSSAELDFDAAAITERFVRGDKSRNTEGSGLGLAIAKSFAELQGGTFAVETDGDLFKATVTFPLCEAPAQAPPPAPEAPDPEAPDPEALPAAETEE
ncbi:MAG: sensor histidine kinase [Ruthenibacterium sp.]